jgi:hypothetical protein
MVRRLRQEFDKITMDVVACREELYTCLGKETHMDWFRRELDRDGTMTWEKRDKVVFHPEGTVRHVKRPDLLPKTQRIVGKEAVDAFLSLFEPHAEATRKAGAPN